MTRAVLFVLLLLAAPRCLAQNAVHHCVSANGTPVFTDQPCSSMGSMQRGTLAPRLLHDCPATREALRQRVARAFVHRDANALAGLMLWQDYSDTQALRVVAQLKRWMRQPLLRVADETAAAGAAVDSLPPLSSASSNPPRMAATGDLLVYLGGVQIQLDGPLRFAVEARAGCFWLRP